MTAPLPEQDPDFEILTSLGWRVRERFVVDELDGLSAILIDGDTKLEVYQGCAGIYERNGGKGNEPGLVRYSWFTPNWYVFRKQNGRWVESAKGSAKDAATCGDMATAQAAALRASASLVLEPQF